MAISPDDYLANIPATDQQAAKARVAELIAEEARLCGTNDRRP